MWQGRENEGYLCENSLRLLNARGVPQYEDRSIPGAGRTDNLTWAGDEKDFNYRGNKRMSGKKFTGVYEDESVPMTLDELDESFARYFVDKEGRRLPEYQKTTRQDIWEERYGSKSGINEAYGEPRIESGTRIESNKRIESRKEETKALPAGVAPAAPMHFNLDTMRWEDGPAKVTEDQTVKQPPLPKPNATISAVEAEVEEELYFDTDAMKWKSRPKIMSSDTGFSASSDDFSAQQGNNQTAKPQELFFDADSRQWSVKEDEEGTINAVALQQHVKQTTTVQVSTFL